MKSRASSILKKSQWHDIFRVDGSSSVIDFTDNSLRSMDESSYGGTGVRINVGGRTGFSFTNDPGGVDDAVVRAAELCPFGEREELSLPPETAVSFEPWSDEIDNFDPALEIEKCRDLIGRILSRFPEAAVDVGVGCSRSRTALGNSAGASASYRSSVYSVSASVKLVSASGSRIDAHESLYLNAPGVFQNMADELAGRIEPALRESGRSSGTIPVLFTPRAFASICRIALSPLNAVSVWKKISPLAGRIGERVFSERLSVTAKPRVQSSPFSFPFDDEGVVSEDISLIEDGVVRGYYSDLRHAARLGLSRGGSASRSYTSLPRPGLSSIEVAPGGVHSSTLISEIKDGIIADSFLGMGQSNTLSGDFSAAMSLAYRIENGVITGRIKDSMIAGNIYKMLAEGLVLSSDTREIGAFSGPFALIPSVNFTSGGGISR